MVKKLLLPLIVLFLSYNRLYSQNLPFYFSSNSIKVYDEKGKPYMFPFTGGLKHPLFGMIDLNNDGIDDLIVLDRVDDRVLTYRNLGIPDSFGFVYRSQYELFIPDTIAKTIFIKDYNNDEKPDIFAFANTSGTGIKVYKNTSSHNQISFELVANPVMASFYDNPGLSNIYVSSDDIPAIVDMDGDGDLDIITFSIIQGYVEYYKNMSQDLFQHSDSLKYILADDCWGKFVEGDANNHITLNVVPEFCYIIDHVNHIIAKRNQELRLLNPKRHAGSTFFANDMDNDGDVDIVLGDIQYPGLILLVNGKKEFSHVRDSIISYDTVFPRGTKAVHIRQMPGIFYMDLDNDSIKDMVVSPMDKDLIDTIDGISQVWLYKNLTSNNHPEFSFVKNNFLQEEMIDLGGPTQPVFFDYDHDGDKDLFIVTTGNQPDTKYKHDRIVLYENTGNVNKAQFSFKSNDYLNLTARNYKTLTLSFGDIDGDLKQDMILGKKDGTITFFKNIAAGSDTARFQWVTDLLDSIDIGNFSAPAVFDIDGNGFGDLFIGTDQGEISYYLNLGNTSQPAFKFIMTNFGGITFSSLNHYTSPVISDINQNSIPDLVFTHNYWDPALGLVVGDIGFVEDIDADTSHKYQALYNRIKDAHSDKIITRHPGKLLRPAFADLDGDTWPDLMLGSSRGGLMLLATKKDTLSVNLDEFAQKSISGVNIYPNPANDIINIDLNNINGIVRLEFTDMAGKSIQTDLLVGGTDIQINISSFPAGFYFIKLLDISNDRNFIKKLIIQ